MWLHSIDSTHALCDCCCTVQEADLKRLHDGALKSDPFISKAIGPNAKIERMRAAALRLGSQGVPQSYDDHLIIVGDAAGHIDPLTGEGIHTAMMVGHPPAGCRGLDVLGYAPTGRLQCQAASLSRAWYCKAWSTVMHR